MNTVILTGRLVKDPELKRTSSDLVFVQFNLAVDRGFKDKSGNKQTDFINCIVWKATAENLAKYQSKGSMILVEGQIQTRNYDDKNGVKHYVTEVVANRIEFLSPKKEENINSYGYQQPSVSPYQAPQSPISQYNQFQQSQNPFEEKTNDDFIGISNDDLPF